MRADASDTHAPRHPIKSIYIERSSQQTPALKSYALKHLSSSKGCPLTNTSVVKDKKDDVTKRLSQKRRLHTMCHRKRRSHHTSQKTTVTPRVTKDDGTHHVSQRRRLTPRVTKTTAHTTCHKDNGYTPCHEGQWLQTVCYQGQWLQTICHKTRLKPYVNDGGQTICHKRRG